LILEIEKAMSEEVVQVAEKAPQGSVRDICYVLFRHKWKMTLFLFGVVGVVIVGTFCIPEIYRSEAKLLVRLGRESVTLDPTVMTGQIIGISQSRESEINSELEILRNRELVEKVVDGVGIEVFYAGSDEGASHSEEDLPLGWADYEKIRKAYRQLRNAVTKLQGSKVRSDLDEREKIVLGVLKGLDIKALKGSNIISISCELQSPQLAQKVIAKLIDLYLEKHIAVHQTPGAYEFFLQQSEQLRSELALSENELRNLKNETGVSALEEQRIVILHRISELEQQTGAAETDLAASEAKVQALKEAIAKTPEVLVTQETTGFSDYAADLMRAKLYELQLKEQDFMSKFAEGSQPVQMVRRELVEARALLDKETAKPARTEVTKGLNSVHQQVQSALLAEHAALSSVRASVENLRSQLANTQGELKTLNDAELRMTRLKREIGIQETNYRRYSENLEQARIDHALEGENISNISVVQSATLPMKPVRPRKSLNLALGLFIGIFGGIALAFLSEYLDHSTKTPEEAERTLQLPILASIPYARANRVRPARKRTKTNNESTNGVSQQWTIPARIRKHYGVLRDEFLLQSKNAAGAPYVLAVVSSHSGEGGSTVAANISTMLAQQGDGLVLLVDANIEHPSVHEIFETRLSPGLANVIVPDRKINENIIVSWCAENLHILTASTTNGYSLPIFHPGHFSKLMSSMKEYYRYVVIDMPSLKDTNSATRLASLCNGVVLVVEMERLRREVVVRAKAQLLRWNANVLGVILNKRRFHIPGWLYRRL
jgi:capsular exopolysaccharide synthesis family protein